MNDQAASSALAATADFFERARARLNLDVPAALTDPAAQGVRRGDLDLDPVLWERAGVSATKPAAVLIPIVESLWLQSGPYVRTAARIHDERRDVPAAHHHWALIEALERGDEKGSIAASRRCC